MHHGPWHRQCAFWDDCGSRSPRITHVIRFSRLAAQPPARRSPTESSISADDLFFFIPSRLASIRLSGKFTDVVGVKCRRVRAYLTIVGNGPFPQDLIGWTHTNKGRRLGKGREEDNVPASHGNERETELTLPYSYLS
jgi:hypothetical protein